MAAGVVDGALIVDTGIDNSGFIRDARQFNRAVEGLKNGVNAMGRQMAQGANGYAQAMQRAKTETQGAEAQIKKLEAEAAKLQKAMSGEKIYSDSYRELTAQIAEAEQQIERLQAKQQEWAEMGISPDSAPFQEVDAQIFELMDNIDALIAKQEELKASGGAYTSDYMTAQGRYQALQTQIEQLREMAAAAEETADAERDIAQNAKEADSSVSSMGHSFKNVLKYGLGIRSLFVLFNRLRGAVKEGFKELEQYSPAVRGALGKLKAFLAGLKGSLAGAFAPILTSVAPALTKLIDLLTKGFNALSAFFAALMGQTSYYVATGIENVGTAASEASDEVRDLNRQLASFDELNILSKKSSGSGSGGSGSGTEATMSFEERPLDGWLLKLSEFIQGLKQKLADFTAGWPDWLKWLFGGTVLIGGFLLLKNLVSWLLKKLKDLFSFDLPDWLKWLFRGKDDGTGGDRDIKINLKKGDWSLLKELDDLEYPVKLIPEFSKKAGDLYKSFKEEWEKVARPLLFTPGTSLSADDLYKSFKTAWDRETRSLLFTPGTTMTAGELYNSFKTAWDRMTRSLSFTPGVTMTAGELYGSFKTAWDRVTRPLTFTPGMSMTAGELYGLFKTAWDRVTRSLPFVPGMSMTAGELYSLYKTAWDRVTRSLSFVPGMSMTAGELYTAFNTAWGRATRSLSFVPGMSITAGEFYGSFKTAWDRATRPLLFVPGMTMTAGEFYTSFKTAWDHVTRSLLFTPGTTKTAGELYNDFKSAWDRAKREINVYIKLVKSGWKTLAAYVGTYEPNVYVKLVKSGWKSLGTYVGTYTATVMVQLQKSGWTTLSQYLRDNFGGATGGGGQTSGGGAGRNKYYVSVGLKDPTSSDTTSFWSKLQTAWDSSVVAVNKGLDVIVRPVTSKTKNILSTVFSKIGEWLFGKTDTPTQDVIMNAKAGTGLKLSGTNTYTLSGLDSATVTVNAKPGAGFKNSVSGNGFSSNATSSSFALNEISAATVTVNLKAGNYSNFKTWVTGNYWADINSTVYLHRGNFDYYKTWVTGNYWADINSTVYLKAGNFTSLSSWLGTSVTVSVNLAKGGGTVNSNGYSAWYAADGGVISNNTASRFKGIPRYAGGTSNAHGTLFIAGEAGPEIVGHIGGRTEILNQSQLAQTMFAAVRSAMSGVQIGATFYNGGDGSGGESDYDTIYNAMYDAFTAAMARSDERDREKLALLRQINEKDFNAEISTSAINRAQQRANRRAGTTIVAVGTA